MKLKFLLPSRAARKKKDKRLGILHRKDLKSSNYIQGVMGATWSLLREPKKVLTKNVARVLVEFHGEKSGIHLADGRDVKSWSRQCTKCAESQGLYEV